MKNYTTVFILLLLFSSCVREKGSVFSEIDYVISIENNSGYDINMRVIGEIIIHGTIKNNEKMQFRYAYPSSNGANTIPDLPPPLDFQEADSIKITYFEKASIMHTTDVNSPVSRSLMLESSYVGGKTGDKTYEFTYTFTPEDYEEALEFGD